MTRRRCRGQRGQSTPLIIAIMFVLVAVMSALIGLGAEGVRRGRVQAVADLTALAAAHGDAQGNAVAQRNGASVVRLDRDPDGRVTVVVQRDGRSAVASASS